MARTEKEIQEFNLAAQEFVTTVGGIAKALKDNAATISRAEGEAAARSIIQTTQASKLAKEIKKLTEQGITTAEKRNTFEQKLAEYKGIQAGIDAEIAELQALQKAKSEDLTESEKKRLEILTDGKKEFEDFSNTASEVKKTFDEIDNKIEFWDNLAESTTQIPILGKAFKDIAEAARKSAGSEKQRLAFASELTKKLGAAAKAFSIAVIIKGLKQGDEAITQFSRQLNLSRAEASQLNKELVRTSQSVVGIKFEDLSQATLALSDYLGISAEMSDKTAINFATLTSKLGLSTEQAAKLTSFTAASGQELDDFNRTLVGTVELQNINNNTAIRYQDVLKDISNASAAVQLTTSKFPGGIQQAAIQARKLGLNFNMLEKSASSLMDFESSIGAELEAELLTGRQLNLDRARMAALTGDQATLASELAREIGSSEKFSKMAVIQQEALAKAMGMSREEVAETLVRQEAMKNFARDEVSSLEEGVKKRQEAIAAAKEAGDLDKARTLEQQLINDLGNTELARQLENRTLAERQAETMDSLSRSVSILARVLEPIGVAFDAIGSAAFNTVGFVTKMGFKLRLVGDYLMKNVKPPTDLIQKAFGGIIEIVAKITSKFKGLGKFLGGGFLKIAGKGGIKTVLKKVPILGAIVGAGLAFKRWKSGDKLGALAEAASGIAAIFPGAGTAISAGIDAALMASDLEGTFTGDKKVQRDREKAQGAAVNPYKSPSNIKVVKDGEETFDDFTIRSNPKDTLVMAGGTRFGDETNKLLKELISAVKEGGNVYMDSNKVGRSLVLGTYQSS